MRFQFNPGDWRSWVSLAGSVLVTGILLALGYVPAIAREGNLHGLAHVALGIVGVACAVLGAPLYVAGHSSIPSPPAPLTRDDPPKPPPPSPGAP